MLLCSKPEIIVLNLEWALIVIRWLSLSVTGSDLWLLNRSWKWVVSDKSESLDWVFQSLSIVWLKFAWLRVTAKKICHRLPMFPVVTQLFTSIISEGNLLYLRIYVCFASSCQHLETLFLSEQVHDASCHGIRPPSPPRLRNVCWVPPLCRWRYTGPHPVFCSPFSTSLLSFVFFFYHLWWLESFSRSAWHSRRLLCQHGLLMTPSVCSQEARGYVEVIQILFSDGYKLLAISGWHHRLFEDVTSGFLR